MSAREAAVRVPPDQRQRDRIKHDLDVNMLVEAAAGTGKTASMIDRMVALLRTGKCSSIATLAAVTFTRKAASELRARFQARLEYEAARAEGRERSRLEKALANIDQCFIGTIHSFCARLLRERPVEARVDLAFKEIEEAEDTRLRVRAWGEYTARLIAGESPEVLVELLALGLTVLDIEQTFIAFADYPDVDEWPVPGPEIELPPCAKYIRALRAYAKRMRDSLPLPDDPQPASSTARRLVDAYRRLPGLIARSDLDDSAVLIGVMEQFDKAPPSMSQELKKQGHGQWCKEEQGAWKEFREEFAAPYMAAVYLVRYRVSIRAMTEAREIYDELRWKQGKLNFQDLLMKSADLLRDKPHVRSYFSGRFTHLLVDEFQDTDPIQAEVMMLLTATDAGEADWKKCSPRPGALFVVGDPKQSIYRFRRADIVTYNEVKRIIEATGGQVLELSANFRATEQLIAWTNQAFADAFPPEATDQSPAYVQLHPFRQPVEGAGLEGVRVLSVPAELCQGDGGARGLEHEADVIARTVRCALDGGARVLRAGDEAPSPVAPRDFMIICYNKKQLSAYARKLQQYGVPHRVSGGKALNEVWELSLLHTCLNAVAQPDNPVALVAALRSELFGVSDASLYSFKKAGGRFSYNSGVPDSLDQNRAAAIGLAFERLALYSRWLGRMPAVSAIELIIADLGLMVLAASREGGDVQAGSVAKALELLRSVQDEMPTTAQLVDYLGEIVSAEAESESFDGISAVPSEGDVVQVMNLHKAKGLQAPVVFLAGHKTSTSGVVSSFIDRSAGRVRGYMPVRTTRGLGTSTHAVPEGWDDLVGIEKLFQDAETTRLLYVAVTRAESMLVVTRQDDGKAKCIWSSLSPLLCLAESLAEPPVPAGAREAGEVVTAESVREAEARIDGTLESIETPTFQVRAAKELALSGELATEVGTLLSFAQPTPETTARVPEGEHGVEWGGAVHKLLELAMKNGDLDLDAFAVAVLDDAEIDRSRADDLVATVRAVIGSDIWARALASESCLSEVPFETLLEKAPPGSGQGGAFPVLIRGSIDLAFLEDAGWVIVDYKTDTVPQSGDLRDIAMKYAPQVALYAESFERCTGQQVKETALYFVREDRLVDIPRAAR